jgi:hypothetical protein
MFDFVGQGMLVVATKRGVIKVMDVRGMEAVMKSSPFQFPLGLFCFYVCACFVSLFVLFVSLFVLFVSLFVLFVFLFVLFRGHHTSECEF